MNRPAGPVVGLALLCLAAACSPTALEPLDSARPETPSTVAVAPAGHVTVAVPEAPGHLLDPHGDDVAAQDLAALWGLPLYRLDDHGQLRPGLVRSADTSEVDGGSSVTLELAEGNWSDGTPVTAADVVATIAMRQEGPQAGRWHALEDAKVVDDKTVLLQFSGQNVSSWQHLLGPVGVLPRAAIADLGGSARDLVVSGGLFRLVEHDPGRLLRFAAHPDGPLGPPSLASIDVLIVPSFERALGLLDRRAVDAVVGHLSLGTVARATELDGVEAAAPVGGTWVGLQWRRGDPAVRRAAGEAVTVGELVEGLLDPGSTEASSPWFGVDGPWRGDTAADASPVRGVVGGHPRGHGTVAVLARAIERDIDDAGGDLRLISENTPEFLAVARNEHDVALRIFRDPPRGSLARWTDDPEVLAAETATDPAAMLGAMKLLHEERVIEPLVRPAVGHAWRADAVTGIRPSAWPGLGFWNVGEWRLSDQSDS